MNALNGTALVAMGREIVISPDIEAPPTSYITDDDERPCWNETQKF